MSKRIAPDPDYDEYLEQWSTLYEHVNYERGPVSFFLKKSHQWSEAPFGPDVHFGRVLEVGAGSGMHLKFVRHSFDEYFLTDKNEQIMERVAPSERMGSQGKIILASEDASKLSFEDNSFDRVIAAHVLEHLPRPHEVLQEWARVLKPGAVLTLVLPCDPGLLWRTGRYAVARRNAVKAGFLYDYWMAREHINPINNLVAFVNHYFSDVKAQWLPTRIPSIDLNLFYIAHIRV